MANTIEIKIITSSDAKGLKNIKGELGDLGKTAKNSGGLISGFGSALGGMATVAGGIVAANIFGKIVSGIGAFAATGLEAVGSAQQLETSLKALLTQNNMYEESVETTTQAITKQIMSAGDLAIKQDELAAKLATQRATYQEQQERIRQLTDAYGENGLNVLKAKAQHDQLALSIQKTEREIAGLTTSETTYESVTKTVVNQTMSQADAFKIAGEQTKELLDFISQVAVISPFETEDVEMTTKYAIAAGLGVDQTKEFVPAFLDLAGAVGITSTELGFAADQLFQVKKVGKLTTIDLRQLRRLGIDLGKVLAVEMGMSIEEFNAEAEKSPEIFDDLFDAVTRYSQNTFAGTSAEMATSVKGLKSTLNDIFVIGARNFWRPLVDAVTPMASEIIDRLSGFVLGGDIAQLGQQMADLLMAGLTGEGLFTALQGLNIPPEVALRLTDIYNAITGIIEGTRDFKGLLIALGLSPDTIQIILDAQNYIQGIIDAVSGGNFYNVLAAMGLSGENITAVYEIKGALDSIWQTLTSNLIPSTDQMGSLWNDTLLPAIMATGEWINVNLLPFLADLAGVFDEFIASIMPELQASWVILKAEFQEMQPALQELWAAFGELAAALGFNTEEGDALDVVLGAIKLSLGLVTATVQSLQPALSVLGEIVSYVAGVTSGFLADVQGLVTAFTGLSDTSVSLVERLGGLAGAFSNFMIPDELIPGSPTPFEMGLRGIGEVVSAVLPEAFMNLFATMTELMALFITGMLMPFTQKWIDLYSIHFPLLQSTFLVFQEIFVAGMEAAIEVMNMFAETVATAAANMSALGEAAASAAKEIKDKFKDAADDIEDELIPALEEVIKTLERVEFKAKDAGGAVAAISGIGGASGIGANSGLGFQHGSGSLGFLVPPGFPNDSFPINVTSGERVLVSPPGKSIEDVIGNRMNNTTINNNNYFYQTINTTASTSGIGEYSVAKALIGSN